jgi:hypothetical protein
MFRRLDEAGAAPVTVFVEGKAVTVRAGDTAAAAALLAGLGHTRTSPVDGSHRAPYCMIGACFECLLVIDGVASRQGCLVEVREGMRIERQMGPRSLA